MIFLKGVLMKLKAIVLAAGKGTRMKSELLKVAHEVAGRPIVSYVLESVLRCGVDEIFLVIGHQADRMRDIIQHPKITYVLQEQQLGTGHAVSQVEPFLSAQPDMPIVVLSGDCPLIKPDTVNNLIDIHRESNALGTILTTKMQDPFQYGRILRGKMGTVMGIREAKDCTEQELKIKEINAGIYVFQSHALFESLRQVSTNNKQGEYYLTDVIRILKEGGGAVSAFCMDNPDQALGINTRLDLAKTSSILYQENNRNLMEKGVTLIDPATTFIDSTVQIGRDTIIAPFSTLRGNTVIGETCEIGPYVFIQDGHIKDLEKILPFTRIIGSKTRDILR